VIHSGICGNGAMKGYWPPAPGELCPACSRICISRARFGEDDVQFLEDCVFGSGSDRRPFLLRRKDNVLHATIELGTYAGIDEAQCAVSSRCRAICILQWTTLTRCNARRYARGATSIDAPSTSIYGRRRRIEDPFW